MYERTKEIPEHVKALLKRTYPGYRGRKFRLVVTDAPQCLRSCWEGGSRDTFAVLSLADGRRAGIPENGSGFTAVDRACGPAGLPLELPAPGYALARHSIFCGKDTGLTLILHPANVEEFAHALPAAAAV